MFKNSGFIYICEFDNGLIKIGKSLNNTENRIKTHESTMAITGSKLVRSWKSEPHDKFSENEKILIDYISDFSYGGSKEWAKIEFERVLSKAKKLDFVSEIDFTENTNEIIDEVLTEGQIEITKRFNK